MTREPAGPFVVRDAVSADLPVIVDILNDAIRNTAAVWTEAPTTLAEREAWLEFKRKQGHPVLAAVAGDILLGFATLGPFRPWPGYAPTCEHSLYVDSRHRGLGVGRTLLDALLAYAATQGYHSMVAGIEAENAASIRLHARAGFIEVGRLPEVGRKFGRWLDLVFMQRRLKLLSAPGSEISP